MACIFAPSLARFCASCSTAEVNASRTAGYSLSGVVCRINRARVLHQCRDIFQLFDGLSRALDVDVRFGRLIGKTPD